LIARAESRLRGGDRAPRLIGVFDVILAWIERSKQRTQLATVDPSLWHDLGLSRAAVDAECRKHFWQN
jgi:uncharacterized protein YjiS (DUF1127 family)